LTARIKAMFCCRFSAHSVAKVFVVLNTPSRERQLCESKISFFFLVCCKNASNRLSFLSELSSCFFSVLRQKSLQGSAAYLFLWSNLILSSSLFSDDGSVMQTFSSSKKTFFLSLLFSLCEVQ
jgi:hypothetical protein